MKLMKNGIFRVKYFEVFILPVILQTALQNKEDILKIILKVFLAVSFKTLKNKILQNWYIDMIGFASSKLIYSDGKLCPR